MRLECTLGHWDFKVLFSALPLLHSSFKTFSFLKSVLPISVEIDILTLSIYEENNRRYKIKSLFEMLFRPIILVCKSDSEKRKIIYLDFITTSNCLPIVIIHCHEKIFLNYKAIVWLNN